MRAAAGSLMAGGGGLTLKDVQREVDAYIAPFADGYWHPLANLARLTEEVGELARELNDRYGQKPKKAGEDPGSVALELGDILFVVTCLANQLGIDLEAAFQAVLEKYRTRDAGRWARRDGAEGRDGAGGGTHEDR